MNRTNRIESNQSSAVLTVSTVVEVGCCFDCVHRHNRSCPVLSPVHKIHKGFGVAYSTATFQVFTLPLPQEDWKQATVQEDLRRYLPIIFGT
jgi:hypothetical protein